MAKKEWTCIYCGRSMDDRRAIRAVREEGFKVYACVACHQMLPLFRSKTLRGKQRHAQRLWGIQYLPKYPGYTWYVDQSGVAIIKARKT